MLPWCCRDAAVMLPWCCRGSLLKCTKYANGQWHDVMIIAGAEDCTEICRVCKTEHFCFRRMPQMPRRYTANIFGPWTKTNTCRASVQLCGPEQRPYWENEFKSTSPQKGEGGYDRRAWNQERNGNGMARPKHARTRLNDWKQNWEWHAMIAYDKWTYSNGISILHSMR